MCCRPCEISAGNLHYRVWHHSAPGLCPYQRENRLGSQATTVHLTDQCPPCLVSVGLPAVLKVSCFIEMVQQLTFASAVPRGDDVKDQLRMLFDKC